MKFCPDCETYLMTEIVNNDNTNKILSYKCKNCNYRKVIDIAEEPDYKCVYKKNYTINEKSIDENTIKYLNNDPTLPHVNNIKCPNNECITNKLNEPSEILNETNKNINNVLYLVINENTLTYLYKCCNCNHIWTNK